MDFLERTTGSREVFSVEFRVQPHLIKPFNEWCGSLCLWVAGKFVGNTGEIEMVSIGLDALLAAASTTEERSSPLLSSLSAPRALDLVLWAVYGDEDPDNLQLVGSRNDILKLEVLPTSSGPAFDNWEAILLEEGATERFIYRKVGETATEANWEIGRFKRTVYEAKSALIALGQTLGSPSRAVQ